MNGTLESSTNNLISPWETEYEHELAAGFSVDELLYNLSEELKVAECKFVWEDTNLADIETVEALAKQSINYDERFAYLQKIKEKSGKTM